MSNNLTEHYYHLEN